MQELLETQALSTIIKTFPWLWKINPSQRGFLEENQQVRLIVQREQWLRRRPVQANMDVNGYKQFNSYWLQVTSRGKRSYPTVIPVVMRPPKGDCYRSVAAMVLDQINGDLVGAIALVTQSLSVEKIPTMIEICTSSEPWNLKSLCRKTMGD